MTLRGRLTLAVAALVAAAIAVSGIIAVTVAQRELTAEVDRFLEQRVDQLEPLVDGARENRPRQIPAGRWGIESFLRADAITQVINADGRRLVSGDVDLPVEQGDVELAGLTRGSSIRTVEVDGVSHRMITAALPGELAIQVARDYSEVERALSGIARRTVFFGLLAVAVASLVAWVLATRVARPIRELTSAAEHVAVTQNLAAPIARGGTDEVGRLATSFNTMLGALDTSRQQQRRLVMDASHELRTPLTSLRTNVDVLRRATQLDVDQREEVLADVSGELDELTSLVTELVDLATESSRPEEPLQSVDLADLVTDVASRFERRTGRTVSVHAVRAATIDARASSLDRAVSNLIDNALKFSDADAVVEATISGTRVAIRDHGPGIDPSDRLHVFDRFYRATSTRTLPGSGLGLAIVAEIVRTAGGSVFVEDPADGGAGVVIGFQLPG